VQFPAFVDKGLAHMPDDLPLLLEQCGGKLAWRRVATVAFGGVTRFMCLAFSGNGNAVTLGMLSEDGMEVSPLSLIAGDIVLVSREQPNRRRSKAGISLVFLAQAARYVEAYLLKDMQRKAQDKDFLNAAAVRISDGIFGSAGPPDMVLEEDVISLAAAVEVADMFFSAHIYGGKNQLDELIGAFELVRVHLGENLAGAEGLLLDLSWLESRSGEEWGREELKLQKKVTAYILALLRMADDQCALEAARV
jgi:hypothetical protein